ncbi:hypothetical protein, partial [Klebsiella pneumoniae]|uniref:hypothetical protein n=1 Tax=Klebsiella pneumoniae TaxID=573 RepID=UPI0013D06EC6
VENGPKLLFPKTWEVGHGLLADVEEAHNFSAVSKMLLDERGRIMRIGSPHLRYWLSSEDSKLGWLIEHTQEIVVELVLTQAINPSESY